MRPARLFIYLAALAHLMKNLGKEAGAANPASVVDASLVQELERDGFFKEKNRSS
jgi:hypothetical protein